MTTDIKKTGPTAIPPRQTYNYYDDEPKKMAMPPIKPKRLSSRLSGNYNNIYKANDQIKIEKNFSDNTLMDTRDFDTNTLEKEIMNDLNHLSDHFKLSEDKLTLYEEDSDERKTENLSESNVLKSLSSLTINDENNVRENKIQDIPSSDDDSFKSIPPASPDIIESKTAQELSKVQQKQQLQPKLQQQAQVHQEQSYPLQQEIKKSEHDKEKSNKSKSKEERRKQRREKKKSREAREEKRKLKNRRSKPQIPSPVNSIPDIEQELEMLKEKEKYQRLFIMKEQEKLNELNQQQYLLLQHQYSLGVNQKKQYSRLMKSNNLDQLTALQQQHERENMNLQQNQNALSQQVIAQQQAITDAIGVHNDIVKKLIGYTGESPEIYALPTPHQIPQQIPPQTETSVRSNSNSNASSPNHSNRNSMTPEVGSPSPMSPDVNSDYYDEGVYSVSGFSVASGNTSMSEDVESVSILTDQLQQSINRRPTFKKHGSSHSQKVRIGGSDPDTFQTTLNAYRLNAHNATDPALQFEYAKFLIEAGNDQYENNSSASTIQNKNDLFDEGFKFLKKLSNAGYPDAQYYLANCYNQDGEWDKAYPLYLQAAKHNHPIASYEIATYYESKRNYKKASQYYKKAASQGYPMAMYRLGCAALRGEMHMRKDVKNAIKWLKRASNVATKENNAAAASYELSELYENGMPPQVYRDELYSLELLVRAAELDYPPAQYKLGWCFEYGELGCPTDAVQSIHWFLLAAENGDPNAQFSLAGWYLTGAEGVIEPNDKEAFYWAMKAAQQEYDKAEYAVAYVSISIN